MPLCWVTLIMPPRLSDMTPAWTAALHNTEVYKTHNAGITLHIGPRWRKHQNVAKVYSILCAIAGTLKWCFDARLCKDQFFLWWLKKNSIFPRQCWTNSTQLDHPDLHCNCLLWCCFCSIQGQTATQNSSSYKQETLINSSELDLSVTSVYFHCKIGKFF